ncbi:MAG TPA: hypothetical protein PKW76_06245 [bacterium]|nr:hypothetical protein [bacterium]HPG45259.1 hypothetical protein [bacterium]HPM99022.1 hypothetical protein [bacterium]
MQTLTEKVFHLAPPGGLFDATVIVNLFPDATTGARNLLVHRALQAGEILRLKPGLFVLDGRYRKSEPHPFQIAALLHYPSHISLESALAWHHLIPEAVYQTSSVTSERSRTFTTPLGVFSFQRVPLQMPRAGVESVQINHDCWTFIATPLRAITDMVYLNHSITWQNDGLSYLTESLRIEEEDLHQISFAGLDDILSSLRSLRVRSYLQRLKGAVGNAG